MLQELFLTIVKSITDYPEDVRLEEKADERGILWTLHINPQDGGNLYGKAGETINSIRRIVRIIGYKQKKKISVLVYDPERIKEKARAHAFDKTSDRDMLDD